jgi:hypothetical protein
MRLNSWAMRVGQRWVLWLILLLLGGVSRPAQAQSCPSGYGACDNGSCCLNSEQCCPNLAAVTARAPPPPASAETRAACAVRASICPVGSVAFPPVQTVAMTRAIIASPSPSARPRPPASRASIPPLPNWWMPRPPTSRRPPPHGASRRSSIRRTALRDRARCPRTVLA